MQRLISLSGTAALSASAVLIVVPVAREALFQKNASSVMPFLAVRLCREILASQPKFLPILVEMDYFDVHQRFFIATFVS